MSKRIHEDLIKVWDVKYHLDELKEALRKEGYNISELRVEPREVEPIIEIMLEGGE